MIDLCRMQRQGQICKHGKGWGALVWSNTHTGERVASIGYRYETPEIYDESSLGWLEVEYTTRHYGGEPEKIKDTFLLIPKPQPFGGWRWFLQCPTTGELCIKLYMPLGASRFRSRKAFNLSYRSQREDWSGRATLKAQKICDKLGGGDGWYDFPEKPKWMRWHTYQRIADQHYEAEMVSVAGLCRKFGIGV